MTKETKTEWKKERKKKERKERKLILYYSAGLLDILSNTHKKV